MQPVLPDPATSPTASLTVEIEAFSGINQIRRSLGRAVGLWLGSQQSDKFAVMQPGATITISDSVLAFVAFSDGPLTITVNGNALPMQQMMVLDTPSTSGITIHNASTTAVVNFNIDYLVA
jgi:hypothetical protein